MAIHPMILDSRIHRSLRISTDAAPFNLVPSSNDFIVLLKVIGGQDTLVITKKSDGTAAVAPIPLAKSFTPPQCPSAVAYHNADCQFALQLDDKLLRVIELRQNLADTGNPSDIVMVVDASSADIPAQHAHKLLVSVGTFTASMSDGGFKVPPDLG
jgi:hypothetical protein